MMKLPLQYCLSVAVIAAVIACCAAHREQRILIHMMPDQAAYFENTLLRPYERETSCNVRVETYQSTDSIEEALAAEQGLISVVKIPFDKATPLLRRGRVACLDTILTPGELERFKNDYLMTSAGALGGRPCLVPRKFETRIMVYCKSKVADAVQRWHEHRKAADSALVRLNGYGLPVTYELEDDPELWDYFDVYMAGWVWAHTMYDGTVGPRVGLRGRRYSGTTQRLYDRIYQLGGDTASITGMEGDAVVDALYWEALYTALGIYNDKMWTERWSGSDVWKAFGTGDVFLSFMTQLDCFFIHGTGSDNLMGYLGNPDDMGVATMPVACSIDMDATGMPLRSGSKGISTGGWWWGIPADAPDPKQAFKLISYITGTTAQVQECSRFGMIPVRKDILGDMGVMFGGGWISGVYDVSFRQLMANGYTVLPAHRFFDEINSLYLDLIDEVLVGRKWADGGEIPDREYIASVIKNRYQPKLRQLVQR